MCSPFDRLIHGRCLVSDRDWLPSFKAGFHHTALNLIGYPRRAGK